MKRLRRGFTLVELLVVIGLIAVLVSVVGLSLGRGDSGAALGAAQTTVSALMAGARAQAATSGQDGALVVNVSTSSEGFLREFRIATTPDGGNTWVARGEANVLPAGIFMVPHGSAFPTANVAFSTTPAWTDTIRSSAFSGPAAFRLKGSNGTADIGTDDFRIVSRFTPRGTTGNGSLFRVVFSTAERSGPTAITFGNPAAVRGMTVSTYGIATLINDAEAF